MKITRTRQIVVEHERTIRIKTKNPAPEAFCEACRKIVCFVQAHEAALICGTTERDIFRRVEMGTLHFAETAQGALLVCAASLADSAPSVTPSLPADSE